VSPLLAALGDASSDVGIGATKYGGCECVALGWVVLLAMVVVALVAYAAGRQRR
jgi:hypothetical protein